MWMMVGQLEDTLNEYFGQKAPQLPKGIKDFLVMAAPYLVILGIILTIPAILALLGLSVLLAPALALGGGWTLAGIISLLVLLVTTVLMIMAVPGLFAKKKFGWDKMFWVSLINVVGTLVTGNLIGLVIGTAITWYFLFQVRSYYK